MLPTYPGSALKWAMFPSDVGFHGFSAGPSYSPSWIWEIQQVNILNPWKNIEFSTSTNASTTFLSVSGLGGVRE